MALAATVTSALTPVLVTGASSGIGAEFARRLHARGHAVALVARRRERLEALAAQLGSAPPVLVEPCDLAVPGAAETLKSRLDGKGVAVHGLVNCAGLGLTGPFAAQPLETVRSMCDVNVRALTELTRLFLPAMLERRSGFVINAASNAAFQPIPYLAVYAATKAFVLSFTEAIADELRGSGVAVQALCPGITGTEFLEVSETKPELKVRMLPLMTAREVVEVSLAALDRRRLRVVVGIPNRLLGFVTQRLAPNALARRVAGELYRPRGKA
jgi:short-subunit dehydrogenase